MDLSDRSLSENARGDVARRREGCSRASSRSSLQSRRILTAFLSVFLTLTGAAPTLLAMGMPLHQMHIPPFRDIASSATSLRRSMTEVPAGRHAKMLADLALESRLNCSLQLDLWADFQLLGGRQPILAAMEGSKVQC